MAVNPKHTLVVQGDLCKQKQPVQSSAHEENSQNLMKKIKGNLKGVQLLKKKNTISMSR